MKKVLSFIAAVVLFATLAPQASAGWISSGGSNTDGRLFYGINNYSYAYITYPIGYGNYSSPWSVSSNVPYQPAGDIVIPDSITDNGVKYPVKRISGSAFRDCANITSVTIPNGVEYIGEYAFSGCSGLTSITIPNSVTDIMDASFSGCAGLTSIIIPNSVTYIGSLVFSGCTGLSSIIIPNSVTWMGNGAFSDCSGLSAVTIGNGVEIINNETFYNCTNLSSVTFGNSVTYIFQYAFENCSGLSSVSIPNSVTNIGYGAFQGCTGLVSIFIPYSVTNIVASAFSGCSGLTSIVVDPDNPTYDSRDNCNALIESITNKLIFGLGTTVIPNTVTEIAGGAFYSQPLTSITIPESVTTIGGDAFENCTSLTSITIPCSVTSIGNDAFRGCTSLTSVVFNATNCTTMGSQNYPVFRGCVNLKTVTIGSNVTNIPAYAFYNVTSLDTVWMLPTVPPTLSTYAFVNNANGRVFVLSGCSYNSYYYGSGWSGYRSALRDPIINIDVTATSDNTERGTVSVFQLRGHKVLCDSTAIITATVNNGYHFGRWSNGNLSTTDTIHLTGDSSVTAYFYSFGIATNDNSRGTVSHTKLAERKEKVQANTSNGYHFGHWTGGGRTNPDTINFIGDTIVTAYFYKLTVAADDNAHGTVSHTKLANRKEKIKATASYGYYFEHWSNGRTANPDTINLVGDSTVTAIFEPNRYTISGYTSNNNRGYVHVADGGMSSTSVPYLDTVALVAEANYGYHFNYWSFTTDDGNTSTRYGSDTLLLCANRDKTATAYFDYNQYRVTVSVDTSIHGSVRGGGLYNYQSTCTLTATANSGYHFTRWDDGVTTNPRTVTVTGDISFTAYFAPNQYTLTVVNGEPNFGLVGIVGSSTLTKTVEYGDTVSHFGIANEHYHNKYIHIEATGLGTWDKYDQNGRDTSSWYTVMNTDYTITYHFAIDTHTVTVSVNDNLRGMVESTGTRFTYGSPCILTATAYSGYTFHGWSNGVTDNPYAFAVQSDVELTALFLAEGEIPYTVTVVSSDPTMGSVSGGGEVMDGGTVLIRAVGNPGYHFVRWNDNNTDSVRTVVVHGDVTYTAYFAANVGIDDVATNDIRIYSCDGEIVLEGTEGQAVSVFDMMGRRVFSMVSSPEPCKVAVLQRGVYLVKVGNLPARKVVVVR